MRDRVEHRFAKNDPGSGEQAIDSATLLSGAVAVKLDNGFEVALMARNLLDEAYFNERRRQGGGRARTLAGRHADLGRLTRSVASANVAESWGAMRKLLILAALAVVVYLGVPWAAPEFLLGGIQVNEADHAAWVEALKDSRMNAVAVTVYAKQGDWDSADLWHEKEEPWVVHEVRQAHEGGLDTVLVLRVALDHAYEPNKFFWHGMISPRDEAGLDEWFRRYTAFVLEWAEIAELEGIAVLAIGSELNALTNTVPLDELPGLEEYYANPEKVESENVKLLEHQGTIEEKHLWVRGYEPEGTLPEFLDERSQAERRWARQVAFLDREDPLAAINERRRDLDARWRRLISEVRERYTGRLTYAANFDQYELVTFWDDLDVIGVNAYFPLRKHYLPDIGDDELGALLDSRWRAVLRRLDDFRIDRGLPEQPLSLHGARLRPASELDHRALGESWILGPPVADRRASRDLAGAAGRPRGTRSGRPRALPGESRARRRLVERTALLEIVHRARARRRGAVRSRAGRRRPPRGRARRLRAPSAVGPADLPVAGSSARPQLTRAPRPVSS